MQAINDGANQINQAPVYSAIDEEEIQTLMKTCLLYKNGVYEIGLSSEANGGEDDVLSMVNSVEEYSAGRSNNGQPCGSNLFRSPGGDLFWYPEVLDSIRPIKGVVFDSYEAAKTMYYFYAIQAGFDVRKSTQKKINGFITLRYFVCNREGDPHTTAVDTLDSKSKTKKRVDMHRCRCQVGIKCRVIPGTTKFQVYDVQENHNHVLFSKENKHLSRTSRQLDFMYNSFIYNLSTQNIGPSKAHRMYASLFGGYNFCGGIVDDFKNFARYLNCHVKGTDAQLLVNKLVNRMNNVPNFSFEYRTDDEKKLNALFWAY